MLRSRYMREKLRKARYEKNMNMQVAIDGLGRKI